MDTESNKNDEMKEIAPGFPRIQKIPAPPDAYFKDFPGRVLNRWRQEESNPVHRKINWKLITAAAAVFLLAFASIWFISVEPDKLPPQSYTSADAYQYVQENIEEFENLIEAGEFTVSEIQEIIPAAEIEEYLIEQLDLSEPEDLF